MLSYRHAFHAGNHADVLKHLLEVLLIQHLNLKDKPYWYIDTHAGSGMYSLTEGFALKNAEFNSGIARLWQRNDTPVALEPYLEIVKTCNPDGQLRHYPGSPVIADYLLPNNGKLKLFELHRSDHSLLQQALMQAGNRAQIRLADGFEGIKASLPPVPRRGLILIDPPYEDKRDYQRVELALREGLKRFANGIYAVWYPQLSRPEAIALPEQLKKLPISSWLNVSLQVHAPATDGFGMHGSGMFIINPPWTLAKTLKETLPWLVEALKQDQHANYRLAERVD